MGNSREELDTSVVTFLLTDVQGSTRLWERHPAQMNQAMARHHEIVANEVAAHGGSLPVDQGEGDARFAAFADATDAVACALAIQIAFVSEPWPEETPIRVRMGLHTGPALLRDGNYFGESVSRTARIRGLGHGGQTLMSQATATVSRRALPEHTTLTDMGLHRLKDLSQPEQIFQLSHVSLPDDFPPLATADPRRHNLPAPTSSFLGRDDELAYVAKLLEAGRLVTVTGPGGCGKTRLATQVAADLIDTFQHGVWFVDLLAGRDDASLTSAIATALGVREEPGRGLRDTVVDYLRPKEVLIVLDNCEHVIDPAAEFASRLLDQAPSLTVLATSREPLRIGGEQNFPLGPLETPAPGTPAEALADSPAARLFVERARESAPDLLFDADSAQAVTRICTCLDGLPLALELAAAGTRVLSVQEIADRLTSDLPTFTRGPRSSHDHHATLHAAIDWSYNLLTDDERSLFARLAVFPADFALEAVEGVCAGELLSHGSILPLLGSLVDKSLVSRSEHESRSRYRLLETIRAFAHDVLDRSQQEAALTARFVEWYAQFLNEAVEDDREPESLEREHENLRTALDRSLSGTARPDLALAMAADLAPLWVNRGYFTEGRAYLDRALEASTEPTATRLRALYAAGLVAYSIGDFAGARAHYEGGLVIADELGDGDYRVYLRLGLSNTCRELGDPARARAYSEAALSLGRAADDMNQIGTALNNLATLARDAGDLTAAEELLTESLLISRKEGRRTGELITLANLGMIALGLRDFARARTVGEEALALARALNDPNLIAHCLVNVGVLEHAEARDEDAVVRFEEALRLYEAMGSEIGVAQAKSNLAASEMRTGKLASAKARLEEALKATRALGGAEGVRTILHHLGTIARLEGDAVRSVELFGESVALTREADHRLQLADSLTGLGLAHLANGGRSTAAECLMESLDLGGATGDPVSLGRTLDACVRLFGQTEPIEALRLFALAERLRTDAGERDPIDIAQTESVADEIRVTIGDQSAAKARTQGAAMSFESGVEVARRLLHTVGA